MIKNILSIILTLCSINLYGQIMFSGVVVDDEGEPVASATIMNIRTEKQVVSDQKGIFAIQIEDSDTLLVTSVGFTPTRILKADMLNNKVTLKRSISELEDVIVQTGYYALPKERSTGSFSHIDNELFNSNVGTNVHSKLEGLSTGLAFNRRNEDYPTDRSSIHIRGLSTINSDSSPLVVLDNFPYEGDIKNINPNDIESVTILKDAAAASIWGARAGNGVIVLTTKKGRRNSPLNISYNASATVVQRPDLKYDRNFLSSDQFLEVEKLLFDRGFYNADENNLAMPSLTPGVEILIQRRDKLISDAEADRMLAELAQYDVRDDAHRYLYQSGLNQQYALNFSGGTENMSYFVSGGYDDMKGTMKGVNQNRLTLQAKNSIDIFPNLHASASLSYYQGTTRNNGLHLSMIRPNNNTIYPYARFTDADGNPIPITYDYRKAYVEIAEEEGLLNWEYVPLDEVELKNDRVEDSEVLVNTGLRYDILPFLNFDIKYQYQKQMHDRNILDVVESYYARNMINRFTSADGARVFPEGGIREQRYSSVESHSGRGQVNFSKSLKKHDVAAIAGYEIRQSTNKGNGFKLYGYDPDVLTYDNMLDYTQRFDVRPRGSSRISVPVASLSDQVNRFVSYYANASYSYQKRYVLSGSVRWDASNLFGVKINQKGVPLWSVGGSWLVSNEEFFKNEFFDFLKVRSTFGYNGNVDRSATAFVTARYSRDNLTSLPRATITGPGNPQLRWEKVKTWNVGVDFAIGGNAIRGSIDYFDKFATDLLGDVPLDPTSGFLQLYRLNYADMSTQGVDVELHSTNVDGKVRWGTTLLVSFVKDKVTQYNSDDLAPSGLYTSGTIPRPVEGLPLYRIHSLPWHGLDGQTGDPLVLVDGKLGNDYSTFMKDLSLDDFIYHGPAMPTVHGTLSNRLRWRNLEASINLTWKADYYFRPNSISYGPLFNSSTGHVDFSKRWKQPGDENFTHVPSIPEAANSNRDLAYTQSEILIEKGDHVRLQDIQLTYRWTTKRPTAFFKNIRAYFNMRNIGIIWAANDLGIDPDMPDTRYLQPLHCSVGVSSTF